MITRFNRTTSRHFSRLLVSSSTTTSSSSLSTVSTKSYIRNISSTPITLEDQIKSSPHKTTISLASRLEQFRDPVSREKRFAEPVGRSWSVKELRRKSYDDLQKLWYVLYKERNMLMTESEIARRYGQYFPQPERKEKVKKSMGAIKQVLGERKREKITYHRAKMELENKVD